MKERLYKELTLEDKIAILHYERGASEIVKVQVYEDLSANPNKNPRTTELYISSVLDFDFEEFKKSDETKIRTKKAYEAIKQVAVSISPTKDIRSSHIVDALNDVIYAYTNLDFNYNIDENLVNRIDDTIKRIYSVYETFGLTYELIPDMMFNNEPVYRRVEKLV